MTIAPARPDSGGEKVTSYTAFLHRDFRLHCAGRLLFGVALSMQTVAIGWYVYSVTNSALALGFVGLASFAPSVFFTLFAGHVADTYNRKRVVGSGFALSALSSLGLLLIASLQVHNLLPIYACIVLMASARVFADTAAQALTPNLVPIEHFANAVTWYSSTWSAANISGPAIGGLLYVLGPTAPFGCALAAFAAAALCIFVIRFAPQDGVIRERIRWETLSAGLRFVYSRQVILGAVSLDLVAVLFGGVTALLPIVAKEILHAGPWALGFLRASPAIGAILMGTVLAHAPIRSRAGKKMLIAVAIYGLATIAFGFSANLAISMILLAILGGADQVSVVVRHTMIQSDTPDEMRGRVAAVNSVFTGASTSLGEFESGVTAAWLGTAPAIVFGGLMTILVAGCWSAIFPTLRNRDKLTME